jgi:hypothetical protein
MVRRTDGSRGGVRCLREGQMLRLILWTVAGWLIVWKLRRRDHELVMERLREVGLL